MPKPRPTTARHLRIVCATDDLSRARSLLGQLAGPHRTIECVQSAPEALACIGPHRPCDLLVTTHALPDSGGLGLVRQLRRVGFTGRVVVLCAAASATVVAAYRALGVATLLLEPAPAPLLRASLFADDLCPPSPPSPS